MNSLRLKQFAENVSKTEALSADITSIHWVCAASMRRSPRNQRGAVHTKGLE